MSKGDAVRKFNWQGISLFSSLFNLALQFFWCGWAIGNHRSIYLICWDLALGLVAIYFVRNSLKAMPTIIITTHNHPILGPRPVKIIDAEFEES